MGKCAANCLKTSSWRGQRSIYRNMLQCHWRSDCSPFERPHRTDEPRACTLRPEQRGLLKCTRMLRGYVFSTLADALSSAPCCTCMIRGFRCEEQLFAASAFVRNPLNKCHTYPPIQSKLIKPLLISEWIVHQPSTTCWFYLFGCDTFVYSILASTVTSKCTWLPK